MRLSVCIAVIVCMLMGCTAEPEQAGSMGLRIDQLLGEDDNRGFALAEVPRPFVFPADHGPHPQYRSEWWYITSTLQTDSGREFGVHYTLFRQALAPVTETQASTNWHTPQAYLAHLAVSDVNTRTHRSAQRFSRAHPALAGVQTVPTFAAVIEDWALTGQQPGLLDWHLSASQPHEFAVDLRFEQQSVVVPQGDNGLSAKGPGNASYYYSIPRLRTSGVLKLNGESHQVSGWSWLDREWSTSVLGEGVSGWAWFALQFDSGDSMMAFTLHREDGQRDPFDHGMVLQEQSVRKLTAADYQLIPEAFWTGPYGGRWPVAWRLQLTDGTTYHIKAAFDDQLMDGAVRYWEGVVDIFQYESRVGRGYMELTGY